MIDRANVIAAMRRIVQGKPLSDAESIFESMDEKFMSIFEANTGHFVLDIPGSDVAADVEGIKDDLPKVSVLEFLRAEQDKEQLKKLTEIAFEMKRDTGGGNLDKAMTARAEPDLRSMLGRLNRRR